jgi:hypothetical protein
MILAPSLSPSRQQVVSSCVSLVELTDWMGGGGEGWSSLNNSILSVLCFLYVHTVQLCFLLFQELLDGEHARSKASQHRFRYPFPVFLLSLVLLVISSDPIRISGSGSDCGTTVHWLSHVLISNYIGGAHSIPSVVSVGNFEEMYISLSFFLSNLGPSFSHPQL